MDSSQSGNEFLCPECGTLLAIGADRCWKCRCEFQTGAESPPIGDSPPSIKREAQGKQLPRTNSGIHLLEIMGASVVIIVAACIAFVSTCFGSFFAVSSIASGSLDNLGWMLLVAIIIGCFAAIAVTVALVKVFWLRPNKKRRSR
jgi:hypothetical protein